jgi:hypothetical protein
MKGDHSQVLSFVVILNRLNTMLLWTQHGATTRLALFLSVVKLFALAQLGLLTHLLLVRLQFLGVLLSIHLLPSPLVRLSISLWTASANHEIIFVRQFLIDLCLHQFCPTHVFCDNQSAIRNVTRGRNSRKTRHSSFPYHLSLDLASKGIIRIVYAHTTDNCADFFTKHVLLSTFNHMLAKILNIQSNVFCFVPPMFQVHRG